MNNWIPLYGEWNLNQHDRVEFLGRPVDYSPPGRDGATEHTDTVVPVVLPSFGIALSDQPLPEGSVAAEFSFANVQDSSAEIILTYDPRTKAMLTAGLGGDGAMFAVRQWLPPQRNSATGTESQARWETIEGQGHKENIRPDTSYVVRATLAGSRVTLHVKGIHVLSRDCPKTC